MNIRGKSMLLGTAMCAALAATANADAPSHQVAQTGAVAAATTLPEVVVRPKFGEHYTVPTGYDSNVWLHPYTSGLGPCTEGASPSQGCHHDTGHPIPPSHYERAPFNQ